MPPIVVFIERIEALLTKLDTNKSAGIRQNSILPYMGKFGMGKISKFGES